MLMTGLLKHQVIIMVRLRLFLHLSWNLDLTEQSCVSEVYACWSATVTVSSAASLNLTDSPLAAVMEGYGSH